MSKAEIKSWEDEKTDDSSLSMNCQFANLRSPLNSCLIRKLRSKRTATTEKPEQNGRAIAIERKRGDSIQSIARCVAVSYRRVRPLLSRILRIRSMHWHFILTRDFAFGEEVRSRACEDF